MSQVLSGCSQHPPLPGCLICAAGPPNGRDAEGDLSASNVQPGNAAILITNPRRGLGQPAALTLSDYIMYIVDVSDPLPGLSQSGMQHVMKCLAVARVFYLSFLLTTSKPP